MVTLSEEGYLAHYGILRRSGRYPWNSGGNENKNQIEINSEYLNYLSNFRKQGLSETEIAKGLGISTTQLRSAKTIAKAEIKQERIGRAQRLRDKGYSHDAIAKKMELAGESSVRALLVPGAKDRADILMNTAEMLKRQVDKKIWLDVGTGVENYANVSKEKLNAALGVLQEQGYEVHNGVKVRQVGTGFETEMKVLGLPGTVQNDAWTNRFNIKQITEFSEDGGHSFNTFKTPIKLDLKRVNIRYGNEGGSDADGVLYVRPGIDDLSLGKSRYAQVRVQVNDTHYLKGMAIYKEGLPDGVDVVFNTNKIDTGNKLDAMKKLETDPDLPFGAMIQRQILSEDRTKATSVMNIVNEEGNWTKWSPNISSQVLSKQSPSLAREQLNVTFENRRLDYKEILALTNPTVKKKLLEDFADGADSAAVHLKAARLPRQNWHAILPLDSIGPSEIFAPNYNDGERVALIRYPHGGTFEIPDLVVNNKNREGRRVIGKDAPDAVGIHPSVAERLSGADFDGDTVLVIPNDSGKVKSSPALERLKNFDPRAAYPAYEGMPELSSSRKQQLMGEVSNLITDMTIRGAPHVELAQAVRHSMVVIDAEKHNLNYKQSNLDHGIKNLKAKYQGSSRGGASTLISRKKREPYLEERKLRLPRHGGPVDLETGRRVYEPTNRTTVNRNGERVLVKKKYNALDNTNDAHTLSSGTRIEKLYADHSNRLKEMANQARLAALKTPSLKRSPTAAKTYASEVASLTAALSLAKRNAPLERQAQIFANNIIRAKRAANPHLEDEQLKKIKYKALEQSRIRTGAGKQRIDVSQQEWNAIQAGAISNSKLTEILRHANMDRVRELATPSDNKLMTPTKTRRAMSMLDNGATRAEVARQLGVSLSTLDATLEQGV